jgi:hypothetical protein
MSETNVTPSTNLQGSDIEQVAAIVAAQEITQRLYKTACVCRNRKTNGIVDHLQVELIWAETSDQAKFEYAENNKGCVKADPRGVWGIEVSIDMQ